MNTNLPEPGSREYDIIRTLLAVDAKGVADGGDVTTLESHGIRIMDQLYYLIEDPIDALVRGNVGSNTFHIAVCNWSNGICPPEVPNGK